MGSDERASDSPPPSAKRPGRRPGPSRTRERVLEAARTRFADDGYAGATIRRIAADAGVDAALVMQYFGSKEALLGEVMSLTPAALTRFAEAFAGPTEGIGERVTRAFFGIWEGDPSDSEPLLAMLRGAIGVDQAGAQLRDFLQDRVVHALGPAHAVRAGVASSMLVGIVVGRRIVQVRALADADAETLIGIIAPALQAVLEVPAGSALPPAERAGA